MLGVKFAEYVPVRQDSATWQSDGISSGVQKAKSRLLISVIGETVELACGYRFKQLIEAAPTIDAAALLVGDACQCNMMVSMELARQKLQHLASESSALKQIASAAFELMQVVRYGDVRRLIHSRCATDRSVVCSGLLGFA